MSIVAEIQPITQPPNTGRNHVTGVSACRDAKNYP